MSQQIEIKSTDIAVGMYKEEKSEYTIQEDKYWIWAEEGNVILKKLYGVLFKQLTIFYLTLGDLDSYNTNAF